MSFSQKLNFTEIEIDQFAKFSIFNDLCWNTMQCMISTRGSVCSLMIQVQTRKQKFPWLLSLSLIEAILRKSWGSNAIGKTIRKTIIITHLAKAKSAEKYPMCMAFPQALHCTLLFLINFTIKKYVIFWVSN